MSDHRRRILVADDDVDACQNLRDILTDMDYVVEVAHSGEEALAWIERQPFDVVLLDLRMPGMDGITCYRRLRQARPETVSILITAYATREAEQEAEFAGVARVLSKPVDPRRLLPMIDTAVRQPLLLVVDDDTDLCESLWDILRDQGYRVSLAGSVSEASRRLHDRSFDVVLIDLRLPDGYGVSIAQRVRATMPEAHVVLMTGYGRELREIVGDMGLPPPECVRAKPIDIPRLLADLRRVTT